MPGMEIRPYLRDHLDALYAISLATGLAGGDASSLYEDPKLMGHIYVAPYASLRPESIWVAIDDEGVGGYITGVDDSVVWEDQLEQEWWPPLRNVYRNPKDDEQDGWTPDDRRIRMIFHPERTPYHVTKKYPAHVHLNLLPRMQRKGVGSRLLALWLSRASDRGVEGVHVGVNRKNVHGLQFWRRQGYMELEPHDLNARTLWMGTRIAPR
jgi:GNAT superfamily N-acetyltransferase